MLGSEIPACLPGHREEEGAGGPGEQPDFRPGKARGAGSPVLPSGGGSKSPYQRLHCHNLVCLLNILLNHHIC